MANVKKRTLNTVSQNIKVLKQSAKFNRASNSIFLEIGV